MKEIETKIEKGVSNTNLQQTALNNEYLSICIYYTPTVVEFHDRQTVTMFFAW